MTTREPTTQGIMFDTGEYGPGTPDFPTVRDVANARANWLNPYMYDTETYAEWLAVAFDPRGLTYGDDDREAIDETNWDALVSDLVGRDGEGMGDEGRNLPRVTNPYHGFDCKEGRPCNACRVEDAEREDALERGVAVIGQVLAVAPDNEEDLEAMRESLRALANYPLLDEDAYSAREWEAWQEYAPMAWQDEIRDASTTTRHYNRETQELEDVAPWLDEETAEALEDADADTILATVTGDLHYFGGFSGEYAPPFLEIFGERFGELLAATAGWGHAWMTPRPHGPVAAE